jgi:RHS repeat-associated protein
VDTLVIGTSRERRNGGCVTTIDFRASVDRRQFAYGVGPRIRAVESTAVSAQPVKTAFRYAGFGRLATAPGGEAAARGVAKLARDALGRTTDDGRFRYTYTAQGQVATVADPSGTRLARYRYNSAGQRVAKTVRRDGKETTTYTLWQDGNRVAELNTEGNIAAQYLYLAEGQRATPIAKLDGERIDFIHADQRGAPIAMTDRNQHIVWRAELSPWGDARPVGTEASGFGPASLNLRLPGQYFDAETGLHDNWHRTYNPATGRYLQPDPLGYPDGPDAYLYLISDIPQPGSSGEIDEA